ncbi:hypothetical protein ACFYP4_02620 [Streptomyces sp. NPDC005551]|uniref:hypothetical protein n=1 Tax=Streptomyces sp. NPDC005551 TaxID=3364725 RepID=UPI0036AF9A3A
MAWLLNEDTAIKAKLSGLTVESAALEDPVSVDVRFTVPEDEYADLTFPLITLTHASIERAPERESRGIIQLQSLPEGMDSTQGPYFAETPVPYNIDYQVVLYTRSVTHRTLLVATLAMFEYLPERFGFLEIPQDNTVRRLDLLGGPELNAGRDSNNKRLFTATYRVRVSTELYLIDGIPKNYKSVSTVNVNAHEYTPGQPG